MNLEFRSARVAPEKAVFRPALPLRSSPGSNGTNMTINAIETRYAGHLFRSRLEARWAVFFDAIDLKWQYEAQGYTGNGACYLPDFYLPEHKVWCEVKGDPNGLRHEFQRLRLVLSGDGAPLPLIVLGDVPPPGVGVAFHPRITLSRDWGLIRTWAFFVAAPGLPTIIGGNDSPNQLEASASAFMSLCNLRCDHSLEKSAEDAGWLVETRRVSINGYQFSHIDDAYTAARQARFEHGESGGRRR